MMTGARKNSFRRLLIAAHDSNGEIREYVPLLAAALKARSIEWEMWNADRSPRAEAADFDAAIVLGGDGFMMGTIRAMAYPAVPFFGVNYGQVGFLMNPRMPPADLAELFAGDRLSTVSYPLLVAEISLGDGRILKEVAFNDFVLERSSGQTVHLLTHIDGVFLNRYSGDGIVVATPGGSSAYSLAAGGPVVHNAVDAMIVTPLYPHRPVQFHSLQFSILLPLASVIRVQVESHRIRPLRVAADGRAIDEASEVRIAHGGRRVTLLREPRYQFIDALVGKIIGRNSAPTEERDTREPR